MEENYLVVGFPRSGNTWLTSIIARLSKRRILDLNNPNISTPTNYYFSDDELKNLTLDSNFVLKSHNFYENISLNNKTVFIVRDPRDVIISYYFYTTKSKKLNSFNLYFFLQKVLPIWKSHMNMWLSKAPYIVKYEELVNKPFDTIKSITDYLSINVTDEIINEAIKKLSFEKLSGRKSGDEKKGHYNRKGIIGDHKNYFRRIHHRLIKKYVDNEMYVLKYSHL